MESRKINVRRNKAKESKKVVPVREVWTPEEGPPTFKFAQPIQKRRMRLVNTGAINALSLTANDLARLLCGIVATTSTTGYYEANSLRIKRVQVWSTSVVNTAVSINIQYATYATGSSQPMFGGPPNARVATTSSQSKYAYVDLRPDPATGWQDKWFSVASTNTTTILVFNSIPDESTIDIDYDVFQDSWGQRTQSPAAIAGAVVGTWYSAVGSTGLTPQGVNYI